MYRKRLAIGSTQGPVVMVNDRELLNFSSNDYLGLAAHPELLLTFKRGVDLYGLGAGSSQLVCGHSTAHAQLEERLARITGRERSLVFSSGYLANLAVVTTLLDQKGFIIEDRLVHASLIDAARLSRARIHRFPHSDTAAADQILSKIDGLARKLVVTDSVFSMDGDIAPVENLARICHAHDAMLMVDDAHGLGVLGPRGGGILDHLGLDSKAVPVLMGTFGKALGAFGAFVSGDEALIEMLIQKARSYIYTTALPPAIAHTVIHALDLVTSESWRRVQLFQRVSQFQAGCRQRGIRITDSVTPIQPLVIGEARRAVGVSEQLYAKGILVPAIRPPTVPAGTSRLRISLTAGHTEEQVNYLLDTLAEAL